jgi:methyl-accepting chemotaxis protein
MRTNLPVTGIELPLRDDTLIVSRTDLRGFITFANPDFVAASGYSEAELLGQPHNILRHPDMPAEAFEDLWRCLKAGRPWTGIVKNRCKNGDHYWAEAHVTPMFEGAAVESYLSVRRKATRAAVEAAERDYRLFREKRQGSRRIRSGQVREGRERLWERLSLVQRLSFLLAGVAGLFLLGAAIALSSLNEATGRFTDFIARDQERLLAYSGMYANGLQSGQALRNIILDPANPTAYENYELAAKKFDEAYATARNLVEAGPETATLADIDAKWRERMGLGRTLIALAKANDQAAAVKLLNQGETPKWREVRGLLLARIDEQKQQAKVREAEVQAQAQGAFRTSSLALGLALAVGVGVMLSLVRSVRGQIDALLGKLKSIAGGNYATPLDVSRNDEVGRILQGLQAMQVRLGFDVSEARRMADENLMIRNALDCATANVRIATPDGTVTFANRGLLDTLRGIEGELRVRSPGFSVDRFVGGSIGALYEDHDGAVARFRAMTETLRREERVGGHTYLVIANPVVNARGERLGSVGEWIDRTAEVSAQREVARLVARADDGDLTARMDTARMEGFYREIGEGINRLLETSDSAIREIGAMLERLSAGDLSRSIAGEFQGQYGHLKDDANATLARLRGLVAEIQQVADAVSTATREIAAGNSDLAQRTAAQASSLDQTSASMQQMMDAVKQNAAHAHTASGLARGAQQVAERGGGVVGEVVSTMGDIQQASRRIADIIGVIDGIAFQTNILALNAAVEAARAGEEGRGFAVVATEVRSLALKSAAAAKEIKALIADAEAKVESGSQLANTAGATMGDVVASIQQVARIMAEIAEASGRQSSAIEEVGRTVAHMDTLTQQNAALVEEAAAAAEELDDRATNLSAAVSVFRLA